MKTKMNNKKKRDMLKAVIIRNNLMNRFIRDIEREEPLDKDTLKTMHEFQAIILK